MRAGRFPGRLPGGAGLRRVLRRLPFVFRQRGGNIAVITALTLPILIGAFGIGVEIGYWYLTQRSMQNAADAAAVAAAANASSSYAAEAQAVAAQYGFTSGNSTVTASNSAACPAGGNNCYSVTISQNVPLFFSQLVGFAGTTTVNGTKETALSATAVSTQGTVQHEYCVLALSTVGTALQCNGCPKADLAGCSVMSNSNATCNGHDMGAAYGDAHGTSNGCGAHQDSEVPIVADPYAHFAGNIPENPCEDSYPQESSGGGWKKSGGGGNVSWSGSYTMGAVSGSSLYNYPAASPPTTVVCGDLSLSGNVSIPSGGLLVIENGQLDTNGYTFAMNGGTVLFSGSGSGYTHAPTGGGTIDISAPNSGPWSGVALYQDPSLSSGVDISAAGNSPTWNISGLVYLPQSAVTLSGAVGKGSSGAQCFAMVANRVLINGTGSIFANDTGCAANGLTMPVGNVPGRGVLVQ